MNSLVFIYLFIYLYVLQAEEVRFLTTLKLSSVISDLINLY